MSLPLYTAFECIKLHVLINSTHECDSLYTTQAGLNSVHSYGNFTMCGTITLRCSWMNVVHLYIIIVSGDYHVTLPCPLKNIYKYV